MFLIIIASYKSFYKYSNLVDFLLYLFDIRNKKIGMGMN